MVKTAVFHTKNDLWNDVYGRAVDIRVQKVENCPAEKK